MGRDVKVRFIASDEVSATLRGMRGRLQAFSKDVTKIAAGIGLADSFKALGTQIKKGVEEAAAAYPKLGAGLARVTNGFQEFRIQAGAAFLEVLQPIVPLLEKILAGATKLAVQLPDAFDGVKIVLAGISGWFQKLPAEAALAFGEIAKKGAEFLLGAASALPFLGLSSGTQAAANLYAWSSTVIANAKRTIQAIEAETDRVIAKYGGGHDFGPRALTAGQQAAVDAARKAAEQALINRQSPYGKPRLANEPIALRTKLQNAQTNEEAGMFGGPAEELGRWQQAMEDILGPFEEFNNHTLNATNVVGALGAVVGGMGDVFGTFFETLGSGKASMDGFARNMVKMVADVAIQLGKLTMAEGAATLAKGLWGPLGPNPVQIAAGKKQILAGAALIAVASTIKGAVGSGSGAGSGGGGFSGSGALSGQQVGQTGRDLATRGKLTLVIKEGVIGTRSPEFRDMITEAIREAGDLRELEVQYT